MNATTYGVDIAKNVFQVHWVEPATGEIFSKKLSRAKVAPFFAARASGTVAIEACAGAHHWARTIGQLGHSVQLLPAGQVRAFVVRNKDDAADARAIWLAAQHPDIRRVAVKSVQQQVDLAAHRTRSHWMTARTATLNMLRGLLYELGVVMPQRAALRWIGEHRLQLEDTLPPAMLRMLDEQVKMARAFEQQIAALEHELQLTQDNSDSARRLREVPGIGLLGATALAATLGDGRAWRSAREFACCLGLVPRHTGSGGKVRMGGISKRGDNYLRTLLIHGARSLLSKAKTQPAGTMQQMLQRRPFNVVAVALANKMARIAWALVVHERRYETQWRSQAPVVRAPA